MNKNITAKEVKEIGTIVHDVFDGKVRFIIMRGPHHWCGYVGVPKDHPLAGFDYDSLSFIPAHCGLTFAAEGDKKRPKNYYWYGWDYGHLGDYDYFEEMPKIINEVPRDEKDWTLKEVIKDSRDTIDCFKKLMKLAEKISAKIK